MAAVNLGGYDPNSGWPPDDSTGQGWGDDIDLPGRFGRGGFAPQGGSLTGPASGSPPGVSLAGPNGNGALVGATGPQPPTVAPQPVNRGASGPGFGVGGGWRNPFTSPHVDPTTGQPEMLNGPGGLVAKSRGALNPFGFIGGGNP